MNLSHLRRTVLLTIIIGCTPFMATQGAQDASSDTVDVQITFIRSAWATAKYQTTDKDEQLKALAILEEKSCRLSESSNRAESKIWCGIVLATHADIGRGISALRRVKQAKKQFESALALDESALQGSAHLSLGSLYYQVPAWPIAFGNNKKARAHLEKALVINPDGMDSNYFYGDFLAEYGDPKKAREHLNRALNAPQDPLRATADAGRRLEIRKALERLDADR